MDASDPTIPDRLILRSLIEDALPARAKEQRWPVRDPLAIAHLVFDPLLRGNFETLIEEPYFETFPAKKVKRAVQAALALNKAEVARVVELYAQLARFRA